MAVRMREAATKMATGCLRMVKMDIFALKTKGNLLVINKKVDLCLYMLSL